MTTSSNTPFTYNERPAWVSVESWSALGKAKKYVLLVRSSDFSQTVCVEISQKAAETLSLVYMTPIDHCVSKDDPL